MDGSIVFARWRQYAPHMGTLAPPGKYDWTCACFSQLQFTTQTANRLVQPFLHISRQKVPILYNGRPFPPNLPLLMGDLELHPTHDSLGPSEPTSQTVSRSVQLFLHRWPQSLPIVYNGMLLLPSKLPLPTGGSRPPSNTQFPGPIRVLNPNDISIGSAVFAGFTSVTDRQTDHVTRSVTIDRIYVCSTGDGV